MSRAQRSLAWLLALTAPGVALAAPQDLAPPTWGSSGTASASSAASSASGVPASSSAPASSLDSPDDAVPPRSSEEDLPTLEPEPELKLRDGTASSAVRYTLERVEVRGNERTRERVILRYLPFSPGDDVNVEDPSVELARFRLLGTGFFKDVQFSLKKGSERGRVVLVVEVVERNTIVVSNVWMGLSADADTSGKARPLTAYGGADVAETNLAGTGITLGGAVGVARDQLALRMRFLDPAVLGTSWMTSGTLLYNDGRDFFGNSDVDYAGGSGNDQRVSDYAVVAYKRFGGSLGVGRDLGVATQLWLHYRLERVDADLPAFASHVRGTAREPVEFDVLRGGSNLSVLRATLQHDTRDHPFLPTRGWFFTTTADVAASFLGSDYGYTRVDVGASRWWTLPWKSHVVRLELFGGAIAGDAPFFEQYHLGDFSDFRPGRLLGLNVDRRPAPNLLGTSIVETRYGHVAAKIGGEYRIPLYRGSRSVFGIDLFGSAGVYGLARHRDLELAPAGYTGLAVVPIDLTANLGVRMDTSAGGFVFALSNVIGFVPLRGDRQ